MDDFATKQTCMSSMYVKMRFLSFRVLACVSTLFTFPSNSCWCSGLQERILSKCLQANCIFFRNACSENYHPINMCKLHGNEVSVEDTAIMPHESLHRNVGSNMEGQRFVRTGGAKSLKRSIS